MLALKNEFLDIDYLVSSEYVRAIAAAKYFAERNSLNININENFGERKRGVESWSELPDGLKKDNFLIKNIKLVLAKIKYRLLIACIHLCLIF